jgi:uncharacterized protein (DUF2147 family)
MHRLICCGLFLAGTMGSALAADPTGDWRVKDGVANIRVANCNEHFWGVVSWQKTPGGLDSNNPDASKKGRSTLGMPILLDMTRTKPGKDEWEGHIYNSKDGKTYEGKISMSRPDELEVKGCFLGFLCGGETWSRPPLTGPGAAVVLPSDVTDAAPTPAPATKAKAPATTTATKAPAKVVGSTVAAADPIGDICSLPDVVAGVPR